MKAANTTSVQPHWATSAVFYHEIVTSPLPGLVSGNGDDVFGEQLLGSSDWPDFEGEASFSVPPKAMPELYTLQGDQVAAPSAILPVLAART